MKVSSFRPTASEERWKSGYSTLLRGGQPLTRKHRDRMTW